MKKHVNLGHTYTGKCQVEQGRYFYHSFDWKAISFLVFIFQKYALILNTRGEKKERKKERNKGY